VTEWANAVAVFAPAEDGDAVGLAAAAVLDAAELGTAELEAAELEAAGGAELELELHAAAPATRQPATAIARHLEPTLIGSLIPVKRTIAPFRLSAV
jgi:hypothetical protein